jgi:hypothetical protein
MSYGLRIRLEYKDINEVLTQINVYQQDYAGIADVRFAHAAFQAEWGDSGSANNLPLIYGSSVTVFLDAEFDYEFQYMFSANSKKHRVEIVKGGNLLGKWFVEPDSWNEPLIATPYPCQFTAYDGLGYLADVDYVPDGRKSVQTILEEILASTGLGLPVNVNIDWVEAGGSGYIEKTIDTDVFEDMSCYDVLEQLFGACRIYQRAGEWRIDTNKAISEKAANCDPWVENEPSLATLPALKQLTVVQDWGYNENLIPNGSFDEFNSTSKVFDGWLNIDIVPQQRDLDKEGGKFIYLPGCQWPASFSNKGYGLLTKGVKGSLPVMQTESVLKINLKYALLSLAPVDRRYSQGFPASMMFITVKVAGDTGSYYLRRKPYVLKDAEFEWINYNNKPSQEDDKITLGSRLEVSKASGHKGEYYNTFETIAAWPFEKVQEHFETFVATGTGIPATGVLEIYLYVAYTNTTSLGGACYTGVKLEILDETQEEYPTEQKIVIVNDPANNETPDDLNLNVGDYPDVANAKIIYKGGFRRSSGVPTTLWGGYTFAEFIGRNIVAAQASPRQSYQVRLADVIPTDLIVVEDPNNPGKLFVENGFVYNDDYQACEGSFSELIDFDIDALTSTIENSLAKPKERTRRKTADSANIEERVTLLDSVGAKVSTPGYLYENDFEIKKLPEDLEDGLTRLQIKRGAITPYNLDQAAGQLQFSMTSVAEVNYGGNANQVKFSAGQFLIHNYNAQDKDSRLIALAE